MRVWTIHKDDDASSGLQGLFYFGFWILDFGLHLISLNQKKIIYQLVRDLFSFLFNYLKLFKLLFTLTCVLHSQCQNVFAWSFKQFVLFMPVAIAFCIYYTFVGINRQTWIIGSIGSTYCTL